MGNKKMQFLTGIFCFLCLIEKFSSVLLVIFILLKSFKDKKYIIVSTTLILFSVSQIPFFLSETPWTGNYFNFHWVEHELEMMGITGKLEPVSPSEAIVTLFIMFFTSLTKLLIISVSPFSPVLFIGLLIIMIALRRNKCPFYYFVLGYLLY